MMEPMRRQCLFPVAAAASILLMLSCSGEGKRHATRRYSVQACKVHLGRMDYWSAISQAEGVLASDSGNSEARYCAVLGHMGRAFQSWSSIFSLLASQMNAPAGLAPNNKQDLKQVLGAVTSDIEGHVQAADAHIFILAQQPDPRIHIDKFPLDVGEILRLVLLLTHEKVNEGPTDLADFRGTWDKSHLLLLGAFVNGAQTMRDYVFAHNLTVDLKDLPDAGGQDVSMDYAGFFIKYPQFLGFDTGAEDVSRIKGNDNHEGLRNQALAAVSYLTGRSVTLDRVAPANQGLTVAIAQSAATGDTDAPIQWIDDGDGIPETLVIPALPQLGLEMDGEKLDNPAIENPLGKELWKALMNLAGDIRTNLEAGTPAPISLQPVLRAAVVKLAADPANAHLRLLRKEMPNIFAINPSAFLASPVPIRDLLPFSFEFTAGGRQYWDMAVESEYYVSATENYLEKLGSKAQTGTDFVHFMYTGFPQPVSLYTVTAYSFFNGGLEPELLAADGVTATAKSPLLYYLAFPYPGLGGLLIPDPKGFTGEPAFEKPSNRSLNEALNRFIQYYCLDLNNGTVESVDEAQYAETNRIENCGN